MSFYDCKNKIGLLFMCFKSNDQQLCFDFLVSFIIVMDPIVMVPIVMDPFLTKNSLPGQDSVICQFQ